MSSKAWQVSGDSDTAPALAPSHNLVSTVALRDIAAKILQASPDRRDHAEGARGKIWQLAATLHCSIIGTCLTTVELRALLRKFKATVTEKPTDHDLHGIAVSAAGTRSPLSKQIQKALDRRHGSVIRRFAKAATVDDLLRFWDEAKRSGDIPGAYWAVLTHPRATDTVVRNVFGDVHMLSHLVGAANRADIRRLHELEERNALLEEKLARQQAQLRDSLVARDKKIHDLNAMLAAKIERQAAAAPVASGNSTDIAMLNGLIADLQKRLDTEIKRRTRAEQRANASVLARAEAERGRVSMEREVATLRREFEIAEAGLASSLDGNNRGIAALDLTGLVLLYVGGRPHQVARLRDMIEHASGQFLHHDGGIEERMDLLPGLVSRADAAFFPVDCISHDAAQSLKRLCRQSGKSFVPLRSSGIVSLLQALRSLEHRPVVNADRKLVPIGAYMPPPSN